MTHLIEILLPVNVENDQGKISQVRQELVDEFGGATLHVNAPAEGLWETDGGVDVDQIIVIEVMSEDLNLSWWKRYREKLERMFGQDEIMVRATVVTRL